MASHDIPPCFLFKGGATTRFDMPIFVECWHWNEKKMIEKIWKKIREKGEKKWKGRDERNRKAWDAYPKIRLFMCWILNLILCGEIFLERILKEIVVEVIKAYKLWCNPFLRRMICCELAKKAAALCRIEKGPDQSHVDHHWRASTLESYECFKIISSWSSWWYMTSDLLLICMFLWFDCNHQGIPRILCSDGFV